MISTENGFERLYSDEHVEVWNVYGFVITECMSGEYRIYLPHEKCWHNV